MTESRENYLKTIHDLSLAQGAARIKDIATQLGVTKPSASRAVSLLVSSGFARRIDRRVILTDAGLAQAGIVESRFETIKAFWMDMLHMNPDTAAQEACRLEHVLCDGSLTAMRQAMDAPASK